MEAFPAVLKKVPNARLIVAGANHHTKAGYWESIRAAQPANLPIEFHGYVSEEAIPELFKTTSLLVLPYDSATGSSGPAHQACEYAVPIVCADIPDLREMAANEDMAVKFYKTGSAADLAEQLIAILQSPELQLNMAERNFAAGVRMTMASVIRNYLRWFELNQCKREMRNTGFYPWRRREWPHPLCSPPSSLLAGCSLSSTSLSPRRCGLDSGDGSESDDANLQAVNLGDTLVWNRPEASGIRSHSDEC